MLKPFINQELIKSISHLNTKALLAGGIAGTTAMAVTTRSPESTLAAALGGLTAYGVVKGTQYLTRRQNQFFGTNEQKVINLDSSQYHSINSNAPTTPHHEIHTNRLKEQNDS